MGGESKRRGSYEVRVQQSKERHEKERIRKQEEADARWDASCARRERERQGIDEHGRAIYRPPHAGAFGGAMRVASVMSATAMQIR